MPFCMDVAREATIQVDEGSAPFAASTSFGTEWRRQDGSETAARRNMRARTDSRTR